MIKVVPDPVCYDYHWISNYDYQLTAQDLSDLLSKFSVVLGRKF